MECARAILNRQKLRAYAGRDGAGAAYVRRPETAQSLPNTMPSDLEHRCRKLDMPVCLDDVEVRFSEELEPDQIILVLDYRPE